MKNLKIKIEEILGDHKSKIPYLVRLSIQDELLALFSQQKQEMVELMKEVIGEDEDNSFDIDKDDQGGIDYEDAIDIDTRNDLRTEQRKRLEDVIKKV